MIGEFFCDVCQTGFRVHSDDGHAVCPDCGEDVLDMNGEYESSAEDAYDPDFLDSLDLPSAEEDSDYH